MAQIEEDSFEENIRNYARFKKSTMSGGGLKNTYKLAKQTRQIMFGFNRKQDNFQKTKQLDLWNH